MSEREFETEMVDVGDLKDHPQNYQQHPNDQLEHLMQSLRENAVYRNVVVARDNTLLAGHGVVEAARRLGLKRMPVYRLDLDPFEPRALKVLTGDNEANHLAERDDRLLSELLKQVRDAEDVSLLGTGYDDKMLANLVYVTRPAHEIETFDAAAEWVGMPEFDPVHQPSLSINVHFRNQEDKLRFGKEIGVELTEKSKYTWWPSKKHEDVRSIMFEGEADERA